MAFTTTALLLAAGIGMAGGYYGHDILQNAHPKKTHAISRKTIRHTQQPQFSNVIHHQTRSRHNTQQHRTYANPNQLCYRVNPKTYHYHVTHCDQ
jgi:uncharacterized protein HemX